jgi:hypothetical protein
VILQDRVTALPGIELKQVLTAIALAHLDIIARRLALETTECQTCDETPAWDALTKLDETSNGQLGLLYFAAV